MLVTGGPPVRGGGGMPQRIRRRFRSCQHCERATQITGNTPGSGASLLGIAYDDTPATIFRGWIEPSRSTVRPIGLAGMGTANAERI